MSARGRIYGLEARAVADWCQAENASAIRAFLVLASLVAATRPVPRRADVIKASR